MQIGEADLPVPKENQYLVKIAYTALNRADVMQVRSSLQNYPSKLIEDRKLSPSTRCN